jgi:hypothetical protein
MDTATLTLSGASTDVGKLNTNSFAGSFTIGSSWTTARIGCRLAFDANPGGLTAAKFFFGFGSGIATANLYGAVTPSGQSLAGVDMNSLALASNGAGIASPVGGLTHARIVNGTRTGGTAAAASYFTLGAAASPAGQVIVFEINKSASTYVLKSVVRNAGTANASVTGITTAQLKTAMQQPLMSDVDTYLSTLDSLYTEVTEATGIVTGASYEAANGYFNAVHLAWNKSSPLLIVDDLLLTIVTP